METTLTLGLMEKPIGKQLKGMISDGDADHLERDNAAINRLTVRGYLSDAATERARKKLVKHCKIAVKKHSANTKLCHEAGQQNYEQIN